MSTICCYASVVLLMGIEAVCFQFVRLCVLTWAEVFSDRFVFRTCSFLRHLFWVLASDSWHKESLL